MAAVVNPIYRFRLSDGTEELITHAVWADSQSYECQREQEQMFFRTKLTGNVVFVGKDADWIIAKAFDTRFDVYIDRSNDVGNTWFVEWTGFFYITDCEVSLDDRRVTVKPEVEDQYTKVLEGMDNEYNLIDLLPEIQPVRIKKHPMVQIYFSGDKIVTCLANGLSWEQEVDAETDWGRLHDEFHFHIEDVSSVANAEVGGSHYETYEGTIPDGYDLEVSLQSEGTTYLWIKQESGTQQGSPVYNTTFEVRRKADDVALYEFDFPRYVDPRNCDVELQEVGGTGTMKLAITTQQICSRIMLDVEEFDGVETAPVSPDDFTYTRNYRRVIGFALGSRYLMTSSATSQTPTEYGKKDETTYWAKPTATDPIYPVGRNIWTLTSIWFVNESNILGFIRNVGTANKNLKTAYPLWSVLQVLLLQIDTDITHEDTTDCSQFLYAATNPVSGDAGCTLMITPKTNVLTGDFSQPATKAKITLKSVLTMLREVYQCYWHIDMDGYFIIEHVSYYRNGGSYDEQPTVGTDLTELMNVRNRKRLAFSTSTYRFDKVEMPERYEFAWMDEVTVPFTGKPIEVLSSYVRKGQIESVSAGEYTSDVDYVMLCPENISKDGFVVMACRLSGTQLIIPDVTITAGTYPWVPYTLTLQNGLLAYCYLQPKYWLYDMAARSLVVNEVAAQAIGVKRSKQQEVMMPCYNAPDPLSLVRTYLGNGYVKQMTVKLTSRMSKTILSYEP